MLFLWFWICFKIFKGNAFYGFSILFVWVKYNCIDIFFLVKKNLSLCTFQTLGVIIWHWNLVAMDVVMLQFVIHSQCWKFVCLCVCSWESLQRSGSREALNWRSLWLLTVIRSRWGWTIWDSCSLTRVVVLYPTGPQMRSPLSISIFIHLYTRVCACACACAYLSIRVKLCDAVFTFSRWVYRIWLSICWCSMKWKVGM